MDKQKRNSHLSSYPAVPHGSPGDDRNRPWEIAITGDLSADRQADTIARLVDVGVGSRGILYFDSAGGNVYAGLSMATLIRARELKATAVVMGECSSAALMPFAACRTRFVTPVSTLLFHPMRWQSEEDVRLEEATEWARHFKQLETDLDDLLIRLFPVDAKLLQRWSRPGRFVSGTELAAAGLASLYDPFDTDNPFQTLRSSGGHRTP
ncbi:MAG: ATP-dependent Clp protease proteolytic subunit [Planctomycetaceae bacterium]